MPAIRSHLLEQLADRFDRYAATRIPGRALMPRAVVSLVLDDGRLAPGEEESILLIKRAERPGDPWSGDMALPGGKMDRSDKHAYDAAIRETFEETGYDINNNADYLGRLSDTVTRTHALPVPMVVTPYVFRNRANNVTFVDSHEVAERIWLPLSALQDKSLRGKIHYRMAGMKWPMPTIQYEQYRIWGLTLMMLEEFTKLLRQSQRQSKRTGS